MPKSGTFGANNILGRIYMKTAFRVDIRWISETKKNFFLQGFLGDLL